MGGVASRHVVYWSFLPDDNQIIKHNLFTVKLRHYDLFCIYSPDIWKYPVYWPDGGFEQKIGRAPQKIRKVCKIYQIF